MSIAERLLPEFDHEMSTTRRLLEIVPEGKAEWKPHPKSMSLGQLAAHIAEIPSYSTPTLKDTELDMSPPGGPAYEMPRFKSCASLLKTFDENVRMARQQIMDTSDEAFMVSWSLKNGGATIFTAPRVGVMRSMVTNHLIHHRGQLSVYLRMQDIPLPSIYGPTADTTDF